MDWSNFKEARVALLGAGKENLSLVKPLLAAKAALTILEQSSDFALDEQYKGVEVITGSDYLQDLGRFQYLLRSPGFPVAKLKQALKESGASQVICTSATDLFLSMEGHRTIGVTGTKGKGTTAMMIGSILKESGRPYVVAGNIGLPAFEALESCDDQTMIVLELSSFQLEDVNHSPHIAVVLPIYPDHLEPLSKQSPNYHGSVRDYVEAKAKIGLYQKPTDLIIFAGSNEFAAGIAERSSGKKLVVSSEPGAYVRLNNSVVELSNQEKMELSKLGLRGGHFFLDAALAVACAKALNLSKASIEGGLMKFRSLPHRLEVVSRGEGITYVDDSYATTPESAIMALESFSEPLVWIGGGSSKGADFTELAQKIKGKAVGAVLLGQEAPRLSAALHQTGFKGDIVFVSSMEEAVEAASKLLGGAGVVLLSPGCASKDMFKDAAQRGDIFKTAVNEQED